MKPQEIPKATSLQTVYDLNLLTPNTVDISPLITVQGVFNTPILFKNSPVKEITIQTRITNDEEVQEQYPSNLLVLNHNKLINLTASLEGNLFVESQTATKIDVFFQNIFNPFLPSNSAVYFLCIINNCPSLKELSLRGHNTKVYIGNIPKTCKISIEKTLSVFHLKEARQGSEWGNLVV